MIRCTDPACAGAFDLALAREFQDPEYFAVHQLTVAAYRLDHPDGTSRHALAVLLEVVRASVVDGLGRDRPRAHLRRAGDRLRAHPPGPVPRPPQRTATLDITDVALARDAAEHCALVRRWATEVWDDWRPVVP